MAKKKKANTRSGDQRPAGESQPRKVGLPVVAAVFVLAFAAAFLLAWIWLRREPPLPPAPVPPPSVATPAPPARTLGRADLKDFFQAAADGDFAALRDRGEKLFVAGTRVPDSAGLFSEYAANSYPPYAVYAFLTRVADGKSVRVLLTMDAEDRVVSFMAEETAIVQ